MCAIIPACRLIHENPDVAAIVARRSRSSIRPERPAMEQTLIDILPDIQPVRFAVQEPIVVAGLTARYTPLTKAGIPALWHRFVPYLGNIPGQLGSQTYGVCHSYRADSFEYLCGVQIADAVSLPSELTAIEIPQATYAVFAHTGHISTIGATWQAIFKQWQAASGCTLRGEPNYELYTGQYDPQTGNGLVEIWIPLKAGTAT
jgi:AraC family transcriptional regulator